MTRSPTALPAVPRRRPYGPAPLPVLAAGLLVLALAAGCSSSGVDTGPGASRPGSTGTGNTGTGPAGTGGTGGTGGTRADGPAAVDGRRFLLQAWPGGSAPGTTRLPAGATAAGSIEFRNGRLSANVGCNGMSGPYRLDGSRLIVSDLATTMMACDAERMDRDTAFSQFLAGSPTVTLSGPTLTLTGAGTTFVFTDAAAADPAPALVGPTWRFDGLVSGTGPDGVVSSPPASGTGTRPVTVTFGNDGRVAVQLPCNSGAGTYQVTGDTIRFGPIAVTAMACADASLTELEGQIGAVLQGEVRFAIDGHVLTITRGDRGVLFRAP